MRLQPESCPEVHQAQDSELADGGNCPTLHHWCGPTSRNVCGSRHLNIGTSIYEEDDQDGKSRGQDL